MNTITAATKTRSKVGTKKEQNNKINSRVSVSTVAPKAKKEAAT